jgi:hypothetical protein
MADPNVEQTVDPNVAPVVSDQHVDPVTPTPVSLKDDDLVEVVVRGEKVLKPWKEARGGVQMQEDYTRSKQELAKQAKELTDLFTTLKSRESTIAEKETALDAILGRAPRHETKPDVIGDDDVVTGKQMKEILAKQRGEFETTLTTKLDEQSSRSSQERLFQRWEDLTTETVESLKKETPVLSRIPQLDLLLKREALADKPQSEGELKQAIVKAGQRLAKQLDDEYTERRKAEVTRKKEIIDRGPTLAKGGPQFQPPKKSYGERGRINFDELERDVLAAVEAAED